MPIRASIFDRLLKGEAGEGIDPALSLSELRSAVRRDIENLLNNTSVFAERLARFEQARASNIGYGIPDLTPFSQNNPSDSKSIAAHIEKALKTFEPRLTRIQVVFVPRPEEAVDEFRMRFRIDGILRVDPIRERVTFDTHINPQDFRISVEA
jgi:type VI secretion system protein ImpF